MWVSIASDTQYAIKSSINCQHMQVRFYEHMLESWDIFCNLLQLAKVEILSVTPSGK